MVEKRANGNSEIFSVTSRRGLIKTESRTGRKAPGEGRLVGRNLWELEKSKRNAQRVGYWRGRGRGEGERGEGRGEEEMRAREIIFRI